MVTEDYVSFEIAKLLKEKGFMNDAIVKFFASGYDSKGRVLNIRDTEMEDYPRPTLQMAMKWLREVHHFHIEDFITTNRTKFQWKIYRIDNGSLYFSGGSKDLYYETYEEACESAIKYCLENLENLG